MGVLYIAIYGESTEAGRRVLVVEVKEPVTFHSSK
jgi:hypothetical protein